MQETNQQEFNEEFNEGLNTAQDNYIKKHYSEYDSFKSDIISTPVKEEPKYSKEQYESVFAGIRPEGMDYEDYKFLRKEANKLTKYHKLGTFMHMSNCIPVKDDETGKVEVKYLRKGRTYIKPKD